MSSPPVYRVALASLVMIPSSHTKRCMLVVSGEWALCNGKQTRGAGWEIGLRQAWITSSGRLVHPCYVRKGWSTRYSRPVTVF